MRLKRWQKNAFIALAGLLLLLAALLVAAFHSETMFRATLDLARPLIPGVLRYERLDGTLAGPVRARGLDYTIAGTRITAARVEFDFSPFALLQATVNVDYLSAADLVITLPQGDDTATTPTTPRHVLDALALPVHVSADAIDLANAEVVAADGTVLLALEALHGALDWNANRAIVTDLDARGPRFDAAGDLRLGLAPGESSDFALELRWKELAFPIAGYVRGAGDARALDVSVQLSQPASVSLDARLRDLLDVPSWQGRLEIAALEPAVFDAALPATPWSGEFHFEGEGSDTRITGSAAGGWPPANGVRANIDATVNAKRARVDALHATIDAFDTTLDASGELEYAEQLRYHAQGRITRFAWPGLETFAVRDAHFKGSGNGSGLELALRAAAGASQDAVIEVDGHLDYADARFTANAGGHDVLLDVGATRLALERFTAVITGQPDDYALAVTGVAGVNDLPAAEILAQARGNLARLDADIESLRWVDGEATGAFAVDWTDGTALDVQLRGRDFNLARLHPQLRGRIGGGVNVRADLSGELPDVTVQLESLAGDVGGTTLTGSGALRLSNGRLATRGLNVRAGDAVLELADAASAGVDFRLDAPALSQFHPALAGSIGMQGHIEGALEAPTLQLTLAAHDLAWRDSRAGALTVNADIASGGTAESTLIVKANELAASFARANTLALEVRGTRAAHSLALDIDGGGRDAAGSLRLAARGGWQRMQWQGVIPAFSFAHPAIGDWRLDAREDGERIVLGAASSRLPRHCVQGPAGRACLGPFIVDGNDWQVAADLRELPVGVFGAWLPGGLEYAGEISGTLNAQSAGGDMTGAADFQLSAGGIRQATAEGATTLLGWESGSARADFAGRKASLRLDVALADGGRIGGEGRLTIPDAGAPRIDANVHAAIDNLELVPSLLPELSNLHGRLTADLDITGALDAPRVRGEVHLREASARVLALGTDWENVELTLRAEGRALSAQGRAESGKGYITIALEGRDAGDGFAGKASLDGENFKAVKTPEANVNISPQLNLELRGRDLYIDGEVLVPYARIEPRDLSTAVQPSDDQVIVNANDATARQGLRVHAAVTTRLGDDVRVNAFGLAAQLAGQLTVAQQPGRPATGNGRLIVVEGEYKAYGQDLTLAKGEIIYTGQPLANPGLDIRAERKPQPGITVGVAVRGPLSQPAITVYSDPAMPQTQALAWLLFGRPIEQATGEEEGRISEAAIALGLGGQKLLGNVGSKLGVEEIRVEEVSDRERASLVLGKYLSPDLYVSYGIGLFEAVNTFRIRYRISSKWTLEATSGLKSSADFIYTIER